MANCRLLACSILLIVSALATHSVSAQQPGMPSPGGMQVPSSSLPPQADVETQVSEITKRYGLSNDQATKVRAILKDEEQKADAILKDSSLPPPAIFSQMRTIREDETTRVSAVLTAEQQKKYQADVKQMQGPPSQAPGGFPPPPGFPGGSSSN